MNEAGLSERPAGERPFALHFPSRSGEVVVPATQLAPSEERVSAFFRERQIVVDELNASGSTTQSTISTPSTTNHTTTSQTAKEVRTGPGGWDKSVEISTDTTTDGELDHTNDPGAADD